MIRCRGRPVQSAAAGYIVPPSGPGLGVELNEQVAAGHAYTAAEVYPRTAD